MREIDARGLACPTPVLLTKDAVEKDCVLQIKVIVDNPASKENVCLFLGSKNYDTSVEPHGNEFHIFGSSKGQPEIQPQQTVTASMKDHQKMMILASNNCMGHGDDILGSQLMINFLKTLKELGKDLWRLVFVNNGVKLCIEGSIVLPVLQDLEKDGIKILVCGTCLNHFNLLDKKQVGETTNMLDIVTAMQLADKVISL